MKFDLLQKAITIPTFFFGSILSTKFYIKDLSQGIFTIKYKPFLFFLLLTVLYYFILLIFYITYQKYYVELFKTFFISHTFLLILIELQR